VPDLKRKMEEEKRIVETLEFRRQLHENFSGFMLQFEYIQDQAGSVSFRKSTVVL
jgi:hypothetical protein